MNYRKVKYRDAILRLTPENPVSEMKVYDFDNSEWYKEKIKERINTYLEKINNPEYAKTYPSIILSFKDSGIVMSVIDVELENKLEKKSENVSYVAFRKKRAIEILPEDPNQNSEGMKVVTEILLTHPLVEAVYLNHSQGIPAGLAPNTYTIMPTRSHILLTKPTCMSLFQ